MDLTVNFITQSDCTLLLEDTTEVGGTGYLAEDSTSIVKNRFKYSETQSIVVLALNHSTEIKYQTPKFVVHTEDREMGVPVQFDGWFDVYYVVLPTIAWFNAMMASPSASAIIELYDVIYYTNGTDIYKYIDGISSTTTIQEILERNTEDTTLSRIDETYVSICFLNRCYISLCQQIFNNRGFNECFSNGSIDGQLIFKRDVAWMAINVIKWLVERNQLAEAERILEQIGGCNGICKSVFKSYREHGCGCSKN